MPFRAPALFGHQARLNRLLSICALTLAFATRAAFSAQPVTTQDRRQRPLRHRRCDLDGSLFGDARIPAEDLGTRPRAR